MSKKPAIKKTDDFNIDDWILTKPERSAIGRGSFNDSQVRVSIKKHPKRKDFYHMTFFMRKKMLYMLDRTARPKLIILKHKDHPNRFLLTRSENGYTVTESKASKDYYYLKAVVYMPKVIEDGAYVIDPIFHAKGTNSGSIIELRIGENTDGKQ